MEVIDSSVASFPRGACQLVDGVPPQVSPLLIGRKATPGPVLLESLIRHFTRPISNPFFPFSHVPFPKKELEIPGYHCGEPRS